MRVIGLINHFLFSSMLTALFIWGIWLIGYYVKNKKFDVIVWGVRYIFITYVAGVFIVTDAYKVFIEGFPTFVITPNLIPFINIITDFLGNPSGVMEQIGYNFILFVPFGFLIAISFPQYEWKLNRIVAITFPVTLLIEILECLSGRYMDIDDIFINMCGSVFGYFVYKAAQLFRYKLSSDV